jgi:hypothetical protein
MRRWSLRDLLVVVQVALSLVALIGAGLCMKSRNSRVLNSTLLTPWSRRALVYSSWRGM